MNPIKGAGAVLLLALVAILVSGVSNVTELLLGLSALLIVASLTTFLAAVLRRRRDRQAADG